MKIDLLGEYDEFAIPHDFQAPLNVAERDNAIACANGTILGTYGFVNESVLLAHAKRRAEFAVMLANGDIVLDKGRVLKRYGSQWQGDRLLVMYEPIGGSTQPMPEAVQVEESLQADPNTGIVAKVKAAVRGRGRPKKK